MPVVQLVVLRSREFQCFELIDRPETQDYFGNQTCFKRSNFNLANQSDFGGSPFKNQKTIFPYHTKNFQILKKGNFKDIVISRDAEKSYQLYANLKSEIFDK